ncbi:MAG TPA: Rrf2 family transcriptional regulator [bacterium]|nr:Rrf2 family transcriptional regulator [bacterium]
MISQTAEYALRAAVHLARHQDRPVTGHAISDATAVPPTYLLKILAQLTRGGVVRSQRGPNGGYALARPALAVSAYDVVAAVDSIPDLNRCPLGLSAHSGRLCPLHSRLREAAHLMHDALRRTSLHDLRGSEESSPDACRFPAVPDPLARPRSADSRKKEER